MFVSPVPTTCFNQLIPLVSYQAAWPMWLKEANGWSLGVYPVWVLVQYQNELVCYWRQTDLSYVANPVKTHLLTFIKKSMSEGKANHDEILINIYHFLEQTKIDLQK